MVQEGLSNDISNELQQQITFALNSISSSTKGDKGSKSYEPGNTLIGTIGTGYRGFVNGEEEVYLFFTDKLVGIKGDVITTYLESADLNMNYPVDATFRVRNGCEREIYWVDGVNPDRFVNLDRIDSFLTDGVVDLIKIELNTKVKAPNISNIEFRSSGGELQYGSISFIIEILDDSLNVINRTDESKIIQITKSNEGAFNIANNPLGLPTKVGSIDITLTDLPTEFRFVRLNAIIRRADLQVQAIRKGNLFSIANEQQVVTYDGFTPNDEFIDFREILTPIIQYNSSKTINQVQNRLVRGNVKESSYDWGSFQKYASKIGAKLVTNIVDNNSLIKNGNFLPETLSEQGDEVVPYGIIYVMNNGIESPVFPLVGTPLNTDPLTCTEVSLDVDESVNNLVFSTRVKTGSSEGIISILFKWKDAGVLQEKIITKTYSPNFNGVLVELVTTGDITEPSYEVLEQTNVQTTARRLEITPIESFSNYEGAAPLNGWDDTVYPTWFASMEHIISEEEYIELAGDLYGKTDIDSLNALKQIEGLPRRYEIYNTATIKRNGDFFAGRLGYYAARDFNYEQPVNWCEEESYWGVDICGNEIEGTPIRHFRLPSRKLVPSKLETAIGNPDSRIINLGVEFFNIEYPNEDVVGHYFVRGEVTTPLVEETGIIGKLKEANDVIYNAHLYNIEQKSEGNWYCAYTPSLLSNNKLNLGSYYKIIDRLIVSRTNAEISIDGEFDGFNTSFNYREVTSALTENVTYQRVISDSFILNPQSEDFRNNQKFINYNSANPVIAFRSEYDLPQGEMFLVTFMNYRPNLYVNFDQIKWHKGDFKTLSTSQEVFLGDTFISEFRFNSHNFVQAFNSTLEILIKIGLASSLLGNFLNLTLFQGDNHREIYDEDLNRASGQNARYSVEILRNVWVDHKIPWRLRVQGNSENNRFYNGPTIFDNILNPTPALDQIKTYYYEKTSIYDEDEKKRIRLEGGVRTETYLFNNAYEIRRYTNKFTIPYGFNYCSECVNDFPNRIIFSPVSTDEDLQNNYKIALANDFRNVPGNNGPITGLVYKNDKLLIHTPYTTYLKQPNPQILQTNESNVYVGTGEFLSLPEVEFRETSSGYGGKSNLYARNLNEFGYQWIDSKRGQVFNYTGQGLDVISLGLWEEWLKLNITDSTTLFYDPYFKRLFLNDPEFTFSYDLLNRKWESFHSYKPIGGFNNPNRYYTLEEDSVYIHEINQKYGEFYGTKYDFQIELSLPLLQTSYLDSIHYIADFEILDNDWVPVDNNFKSVWAYNDYQSTGKLNLLKSNSFNNLLTKQDTIVYSKVDDNYKVSELWDQANGNPIFTGADINKEPINYNQNLFNRGLIKSKYVKVRLYFNSEEDIKCTLNYLSVNVKPSYR